MDLKVHVCLLTYDGGPDENGSEKDAKVEAILEYGWASQDDSHEITMVDFKGDVFLKTLPSPQPGESLNVTLISRLGPSQTFFPSQKQAFHQPIAQLSTSIHHDAHGIVHLTLCHELETVDTLATFSPNHLIRFLVVGSCRSFKRSNKLEDGWRASQANSRSGATT